MHSRAAIAYSLAVFGPRSSILGILLLVGSLVGCCCCAEKSTDAPSGAAQVPAKTIEEVLAEHSREWMSLPGVMGTAIGEFQSTPCIKVLVLAKTAVLIEKIPPEVEGFRVIIEEVGAIHI